MAKDPIAFHKKLGGKIFVQSKLDKITQKDIKLIYTPGVAKVCKEIAKDPKQKYILTSKSNNVAIVTDGTRVLGLGNIGPDGALPVMEGKAMLYRKYGNVSAYPICLSTTNKKEIIDTVIAIEPVFGAINIEDIESPKVLEIAQELDSRLNIPVFHDDGQGTAMVALAAVINSLKLVEKNISEIKTVIVGSGSAGYWITKLFAHAGCKKLVVVDSKGVIYQKRKNTNKFKKEIAGITRPKERGSLHECLIDADVFVGVSGIKNLLKKEMIQGMKKNPIILALTNPDPEITPQLAKQSGAKIVATGSYNYKNQVNNALVFPYFMRAILDLRIRNITLDVLYNSSIAIAETLSRKELSPDRIIPDISDKRLQSRVRKSLKKSIK